MDEGRRLVRLGLAQMSMVPDQGKNLAKAQRMIASAAKKGADIVCLPELFTTMYFAQYDGQDLSSDEKGAFLETIPGKVTDALCQAADRHNVVVVGGSIYERAGKWTYNTSIVADADGRMLGKYRKTHVPHDDNFYEQHYFERGDSGFPVFQTRHGRISVLICYDQWFPEAARCCALDGAEVIFYPTAIGTVQGIQQTEGNWKYAWENVMRGHAIANNVIVAAVNRCGVEDRMTFWGGSFVIDAFGSTLSRAPAKDTVVVTEADLDHSAEVRQGWGFFRNRRPACYSRIMEK
ncbi:MAG TPA: nitrilase-related carbon-nitrogen hydrolase [Methanomassiliicoccales archaeon]|nr:nitrilase-related carbon-nitrogen hydrolase [Methanomassiliicoccales archaeon]